MLADRGLVDQVAQTVHAPPNLLGAPLVIAIVVSGKGPAAFDTGRAAQNMMLAAWNAGVVAPNQRPRKEGKQGLGADPSGPREG